MPLATDLMVHAAELARQMRVAAGGVQSPFLTASLGTSARNVREKGLPRAEGSELDSATPSDGVGASGDLERAVWFAGQPRVTVKVVPARIVGYDPVVRDADQDDRSVGVHHAARPSVGWEVDDVVPAAIQGFVGVAGGHEVDDLIGGVSQTPA
jgi:hypothetical protein